MENPNTWTEAQKVIAEALAKNAKDMEEHVCGLSLVSQIYYALVKSGHIKEEKE